MRSAGIENNSDKGKKMITEDYLLNFQEAEIIGDRIIFWALNSNGIFSYDLKNKTLDCLSKTEKYDNAEFLFNGCAAYNSKIFFSPFNSSSICIYETETDEIEYIKLEKKGLFSSVFVYGDKIYFWGFGKNNVKVMLYPSHILQDLDELTDVSITSKPLIVENKVYFTIDEMGGFCEYDLSDGSKFRVHKLESDCKFNTISYAGDCLWFSGDKKKIIAWNTIDNEVQSYPLTLTNVNQDITWNEFFFDNSFVMGKYVYYLPKKTNEIIRIRIDSGTIEIVYVIDGANGGNFIRISDEYGLIVVEGGNHDAICDIFVEKRGTLVRNDEIKVPKGSELEKYICWGSLESRFNTLNRFIRSLTQTNLR
ncbi:hypothetical protein SAMN04487928_11934 [Butyrivibrio proteoclasticus]|uniref:Uncharacterized protein n=2 Tax=Butyrivibrio proteoclasticus TaxID=43305 RepID=A0A1I5VWK5_9FIRM|nr:hypothetical protein SAMN04487928_11934 [Butyrivibrio proteoclasticus]